MSEEENPVPEWKKVQAELEAKSKDELERIKLAREINSSGRSGEFWKNQVVVDIAKGVVITVIGGSVALASGWFTGYWQRQYAAQERERNEKSANAIEEKKSFLRYWELCAVEKDPARQVDMACDLLDLMEGMDRITVASAQRVFGVLCKERGKRAVAQAKSDQLLSNVSSKDSTRASELAAFADSLDWMSRQASSSKAQEKKFAAELARAKRQLDSLKQRSPALALAFDAAGESGSAASSYSAASIVARESVPNPSRTISSVSWFKEGYFLRFGDHRILLQYLDKSLGAQIQICKTRDSGSCKDPLKNKEWIGLGKPLQFSDGGKQYRINLEAIDHAGKNPFTLAAYITFETLN